MANCVNKNHPDIISISEQYNEPVSIVAAKIGVWQEDNGLDKWPTPSDLGYAAKSTIKESAKRPVRAIITTKEAINKILNSTEDSYLHSLAQTLLSNNIVDRTNIFMGLHKGGEYGFTNIIWDNSTGNWKANTSVNVLDRNLLSEYDKNLLGEYVSETILHEELHRYTSALLNTAEQENYSGEMLNELFNAKEIQFAKEIKELHSQYITQGGKLDINEFLAYGLTNKEVIKSLQQMKVNKTSILENLFNSILKLLGIVSPSLHTTLFNSFKTYYTNFNTELYTQITEAADATEYDMFQKSSTNSTSPSAELNSKLQGFLDKIGVKVETLGEGDFVAKAKLVEKIIQVVQGKADISTLPEETAHFFVDLLKANGSGLFAKMMADITNHPIYQQTLEEYRNIYVMTDGTPDFNRIKEEAIGKLIAQNIVKMYQSGLKANEDSKKSLLDRAWSIIKAAFAKALNSIGITSFQSSIDRVEGKDVYEISAAKIMSADVSDLNLGKPLSSYEMYQRSTATQAELNDAINKSQNRITGKNEMDGFEEKHYYVLDEGTDRQKSIKTTPSTIAQNSSRKKNKNKYVSEDTQRAWEKIKNRGKKVHAWVEDMTINLTSETPVNTTKLFDSLTPSEQGYYKKLESQVKSLIDSIKKDEPGSIFKTEVKVYDPNYRWTDDKGVTHKGIAGSIDLLVLHPNGTASIYDWKTTSKKKNMASISIWKSYEYSMQVALYKRMLMDGNEYMGVPKVKGIYRSRLIEINTDTDIDGKLTKVELIGDIPVAGESTGSAALDSKLQTMYNRFYTLMNTKPPKEKVDREHFYSRIESLRNSIVSMHLRRNYEKVIEDADSDLTYVEELLSKENITLDDVKIGLEVSELYSDLLDYVDKNEISKEAQHSISEAALRAIGLKKVLVDKQQLLLQTLADDYGTGNINQVQRQVPFLEKTFRAASGVNHPLIATLYEMSTRALYEAEQKNNTLRADITKHQEVLKKWASSKGKTLQQAYDMIINKASGNLISEFSKEFWDFRNKATDEWLKENMEVDVEWFNKQLAYEEERIKTLPFHRKPEEDAKRKAEYIADFKKVNSNVTTSSYIKVKESKRDKWQSKEWQTLNKPENKELLKFYTFFNSKTKEMAQWLPNFGWRPTFIPSIRKTWMENLSKLNAKTGANLYKALVSRIGVTEMNTSANVDEATGTYGGSVPVYFTSGLDAKDKSYDLGRILQMFGEMAHNFYQMSEIETAAQAGLEIIKQQEAYDRSSFSPLGLVISPITQNPNKSVEANKGWVEMYKTFMDYYLYNVRTANPTKFTRFLDGLGGYTSFNLLGLNPMPAIAATVANLANTQIQIGRNIYFDNKQYSKALWMLSGGKLNGEQKDITYALLQLFEPTIDTMVQAKNRKLSTNIAVRNVTVDHFFAMLRTPDELNQKAVFLAMLQNSVFHDGKIVLKSDYAKNLRPINYYSLSKEERKVIDKDIAEKVKTKKSIVDSCSIKDGKLHIEGMPEISTELVRAYRQMVRQVNKSIIGNMDANDIFTAKTNAYARALMVFRNWMPRALEERYVELRYNRELGRHEWGRYRTMFTHLFGFTRDEAQKLKWHMMIGVEAAAKLEYMKYINIKQDMADQLSEMEFIDLYKENINAQYRGVAITIGILLLMLLAGKYFDDDEDMTPGEKYYAKVVRRAYSEMSMFINPVEALNILKSPTALTSPLTGVINLMSHSLKELGGLVLDSEELQKNNHPLKYLLQYNPLSGIERTYRIFDEQYEDFLDEVNQDE